jgi:small neutral amino acid transporter SnatA (MarC family)
VVARGVATVALAAACWAVWYYSPAALALLGLDDLDIPGRVCAVFLFLTVVEAVLARVPTT